LKTQHIVSTVSGAPRKRKTEKKKFRPTVNFNQIFLTRGVLCTIIEPRRGYGYVGPIVFSWPYLVRSRLC